MSEMKTLIIKLPSELAAQMPEDQAERQQIFLLGLVQLRVKKALEEYRQGDCSLAYAAKRAGISLREIIPLAYAHGLEPKVDPDLLEGELTMGQAALL